MTNHNAMPTGGATATLDPDKDPYAQATIPPTLGPDSDPLAVHAGATLGPDSDPLAVRSSVSSNVDPGTGNVTPGATVGNTASGGNTLDSSASPERDVEADFEAIELLGKSFRVKRAIENVAVARVTAWNKMRSGVANWVDKHDRNNAAERLRKAQVKLAKKKGHRDAAKSKVLKKLRHDPAVAKAQKRVNTHQATFTKIDSRMTARTKNADETIKAREKTREETLKSLKDRQASALAKKEMRHQLLHLDDASRRETRQILAATDPEQLKTLGNLLLIREASRRRVHRAEQGERRTTEVWRGANTDFFDVTARLDRHLEAERTAVGDKIDLETVKIPGREVEIGRLQAELDALRVAYGPTTESQSRYLQLTHDIDVHKQTLAEDRRRLQYINDLPRLITQARTEQRAQLARTNNADQARTVASQTAQIRRDRHTVHATRSAQEMDKILNPADIGPFDD